MNKCGFPRDDPLLVLASAAYDAIHRLLAEEPGLVQGFGDEYLIYKKNVPRWIPRLTAWPTEPSGHDTKTS